jgi:hypothetical protein
MTPNDSRAEILALIQRVNSAWLEGPPGDVVARVAPYLAQDTMVYGPDFQVVARGRDACAASYEWSMTYTLNDATYSETGREVIVFNHHESDWRAVWRAMLPAPT